MAKPLPFSFCHGESPQLLEKWQNTWDQRWKSRGIRCMRRSFWVASPTTRMVEAAPSPSCRQGFSRWKPRCPLALQRSNSSATRMPPARSRARTTSCASAKRRGLVFHCHWRCAGYSSRFHQVAGADIPQWS